MVDALEVSAYLQRDGAMNTKKVLKLVYYTQAWSMAWTGRPLFVDPVEAWIDGPVVNRVWQHEIRGSYEVPASTLSTDQIAVIDAVVAHYGNMSGNELSDLTHTEEPWIEARGALPPEARTHAHLKLATMQSFFSIQAVQREDVPRRPNLSYSIADSSVLTEAQRQISQWQGALTILADR